MVNKSNIPVRAKKSVSFDSALLPENLKIRSLHRHRNQKVPKELELDPTVVEKQDYAQACRQGDIDKVKKFIKKHRSTIDCQLEDDATGLLIAAQSGHVSVMAHLLSHGANPCYVKPKTQGGNSILQSLMNTQETLTEDHVECAKKILDYVRMVRVPSGEGEFIKGIDHVNTAGETALVLAVKNQHVEMVRLLLKGGADFKKITNSGQKITDVVRESKNRAIVQLFLQTLKKKVDSEELKNLLAVMEKISEIFPKEDWPSGLDSSMENNNNKMQSKDITTSSVAQAQDQAKPETSVQPQPIPCKRQVSDEDFMKLRSKNKDKTLLLLKLEGLEQYVDSFDNAGIGFNQLAEVSKEKLDELEIPNEDDKMKIVEIVDNARLENSRETTRTLKFKKPTWAVSNIETEEHAESMSEEVQVQVPTSSANRGYFILPLIGLILGIGWLLIKK